MPVKPLARFIFLSSMKKLRAWRLEIVRGNGNAIPWLLAPCERSALSGGSNGKATRIPPIERVQGPYIKGKCLEGTG
jgi:hypothetical protein